MMSSNTAVPAITGLSDLVEAATALAKLTKPGVVQVPTPSTSPSACSDTGPRTMSSRVGITHSTTHSDKDFQNNNVDSSKSKREIFPQRLLAILNDDTLGDVVAWLPHGRSFVILRPDVFTDKVLPKYLPPVDSRGSTKYPSFTRKLNRWGFRQATRGPDTGAFHHPLFRRDEPEACLQMVCQRSRENVRKRPGTSSKQQQPTQITPPLKVAPLTKEALDVAATNQSEPPPPRPSVVSVTDDARSESSSSNGVETKHNQGAAFRTEYLKNYSMIPRGITNDPRIKADSLKLRDEAERIKVAQAMLYESFMKALRGE